MNENFSHDKKTKTIIAKVIIRLFFSQKRDSFSQNFNLFFFLHDLFSLARSIFLITKVTTFMTKPMRQQRQSAPNHSRSRPTVTIHPSAGETPDNQPTKRKKKDEDTEITLSIGFGGDLPSDENSEYPRVASANKKGHTSWFPETTRLKMPATWESLFNLFATAATSMDFKPFVSQPNSFSFFKLTSVKDASSPAYKEVYYCVPFNHQSLIELNDMMKIRGGSTHIKLIGMKKEMVKSTVGGSKVSKDSIVRTTLDNILSQLMAVNAGGFYTDKSNLPWYERFQYVNEEGVKSLFRGILPSKMMKDPTIADNAKGIDIINK